jgi:hypothetical protein
LSADAEGKEQEDREEDAEDYYRPLDIIDAHILTGYG